MTTYQAHPRPNAQAAIAWYSDNSLSCWYYSPKRRAWVVTTDPGFHPGMRYHVGHRPPENAPVYDPPRLCCKQVGNNPYGVPEGIRAPQPKQPALLPAPDPELLAALPPRTWGMRHNRIVR